MVLNLAISESFQTVNLETLDFPAQLLVDYVRVYQRKGKTNIGCDGKDNSMPTTGYIQDHLVAYSSESPSFFHLCSILLSYLVLSSHFNLTQHTG